ncbi:MAG: Ldh family oxidoreductase [Anaerolineae bacterium]|nr:Ldh family oxidoreductase [Anaerolineae bacterium]
MIIVESVELCNRIFHVFCAAGVPEAVAQRVAESLVEAHLTGHDSHGVLRVPWYLRAVREGQTNPRAEIRVERASATTAILDCDNAFGQVGALEGMRLAVDKAKQHDIAMVTLRHCGHVGRLGEYVVWAAEQGMLGLMLCNGPSKGGIVAPFGGNGRALGTNPVAWAVPGPPDGRPVFLDYATSAVAHGKLQVAIDKGQPIPEGWLLDKHGRPTTDPRDVYDGGVMLPFFGHKGYAMSVFVELLAGGLSGAGPALLPGVGREQGTMLVVVRIEAFQGLDEYRRMVGEFAQQIKATPRAPGVDEILLPGEPEWRSKAQREREGIPLPEKTWADLTEAAASVQVAW